MLDLDRKMAVSVFSLWQLLKGDFVKKKVIFFIFQILFDRYKYAKVCH